ncbi:MAG: 30S ribosomal protein S9, partial [Candidatus Bathyarchaeia archaeon]
MPAPVTKKILVVSGKRKTAIARAVVKPGMGRIRINNIPLEIYEPEIARLKILEPLIEAGEEVWKELDINVDVR